MNKILFFSPFLAFVFAHNAHARTLYWAGGTTNKIDGAPLPTLAADLEGTWDGHTLNWATDERGTTYVAWEDGDDVTVVLPPMEVSANRTIKLTQSVTLNKILMPLSAAGNTARIYTFNADAPYLTVTLAGDRPEIGFDNNGGSSIYFSPNVKLAAANGFDQSGRGRLWVQSPSDQVYGAYKAQRGFDYTSLNLSSNYGAMTNVPTFVLDGPDASLDITMPSAIRKIGADTVVKLRGRGAFRAQGGTAHPFTNDFQRLEVDSFGILHLGSFSAAFRVTGAPGFVRGGDGTATLMVEDSGTQSTYLNPAFPGRFIVQNGPAGEFLPWASTRYALPVWINPQTRLFEKLAVSNAPTDVALWQPGHHYHIEGAYTPSGPLGTTTIKSLGIHASNALTLTLQPGALLTLESGHLGTRQNNTRTFTGGSITSGTNTLYILRGVDGSGSLTFNSVLADNGAPVDVVISGCSHFYFSGAESNTHTGTTYVNGGSSTLLGNGNGITYLNKTGGAISILGNLVINAGGAVVLNGGTSPHINPSSNVTIREGGVLTFLGNARQNFAGVVTLENGLLRFAGEEYTDRIVFSHNGFGLVFADGGFIVNHRCDSTASPSLLTDVLYPSTATRQALITTIRLGDYVPNYTRRWRMLLSTSATPVGTPTRRVFDIQKSDTLPKGEPEMLVEIPLAAETSGGIRPVELVKTGDGDMVLEMYAGYFFGDVLVTNGTLFANGPYTTQSVMTASALASQWLVMDSNEGLQLWQPVTLPNNAQQWVAAFQSGSTTNAQLTGGLTAGTSGTYTFHACGSLGTANAIVSDFGTLGGTSGVGGNLTVLAGGALSPGNFAEPVAAFHVGGNLIFNGGSWQADILATEVDPGVLNCDVVHVAGSIFLGGDFTPNFMDSVKRPKGTWVVATYGVDAEGAMTAPQGCKVRIDKPNKRILFTSAEPGTLLMMR